MSRTQTAALPARETAVVICPGRGTYASGELGYLARHHAGKTDLLDTVDRERSHHGQFGVRDLDAETSYSARRHAASENASALIHACAMGDLADIDLDRYDIVAVTGNSMGWYLALTAAGVLDAPAGIKVVNTMGTLMEREGTGGQVVYPIVDGDWRPDPAAAHAVETLLARAADHREAQVYPSIRLGGMIVLAGNDAGLSLISDTLAPKDRFPLRLAQHAAFHTPLLAHVPPLARAALTPDLFARPRCPLIDGRGQIWSPWSADLEALHAYTFGHQIVAPYDFSRAIEVAIKEFAPDRLILLGPGTALGAPVAQALIRARWWGLDSKAAFAARQQSDPVVLSMGMDDQRRRVAA